MRTRIFASIRSLDPLALGAASKRLVAAGVDGLHVDLADGVFVPELTFGAGVIKALIEQTRAGVRRSTGSAGRPKPV